MKTGFFFKAFGLGMLLGTLPSIVSANESGGDRLLVVDYVPNVELSLIDSIPKVKPQDDKGKKSKKKPEKPDVDKDKAPVPDPKTADVNLKDPKRPAIKEVPKARPQLRPGVVTDRIKIKRPPVRVKPGRRLGGPLGL